MVYVPERFCRSAGRLPLSGFRFHSTGAASAAPIFLACGVLRSHPGFAGVEYDHGPEADPIRLSLLFGQTLPGNKWEISRESALKSGGGNSKVQILTGTMVHKGPDVYTADTCADLESDW